jgi:hypothetical protein
VIDAVEGYATPHLAKEPNCFSIAKDQLRIMTNSSEFSPVSFITITKPGWTGHDLLNEPD